MNLGTEGEGAMPKHQQSSEFEEYVKSRERKINRALSEIEKRGAAAALDKCRVLAEQIDGDLRNKKHSHVFNNIASLAEFQVSIERAASVLGRSTRPGKQSGTKERHQRCARSNLADAS
jgi:hypothetical protein